MSADRRELGKLGENFACDFLGKRGYKIISQNYRIRGGEIDIIAEDGDTIVFIEVKTRKSLVFGHPEEAINKRKQHKLALVAEQYLSSHELYEKDYRIDVIGIEVGQDGQLVNLRHGKDIVGW